MVFHQYLRKQWIRYKNGSTWVWLSNDPPTVEPSTITVNGQTLFANPPAHQSKKQKVTLDIHSWIQAYSAYAAALTSVEETSKPESAGLLAHMYNVMQLASDLGGNQWVQYDKAFREWVAAKEVKVWGELNLPIFCQCLATQQRSTPQPREFSRPSNSPYSRESRRSWPWNFEDSCTR